MKPKVYVAGDYAGATCGGVKFYFGYEVTKCKTCDQVNCKSEDHEEKEWCFTADFGETSIVIPESKLGVLANEGMELPLLQGIMWVFAKYDLVLREKRPTAQTDQKIVEPSQRSD